MFIGHRLHLSPDFERRQCYSLRPEIFPGASPATVSYSTNTIYPPPGSAALPYKTDLDRAALITSDVVLTCNTYLLAVAYQNYTYNYLFGIPPALHGGDLHYTLGPDLSTTSGPNPTSHPRLRQVLRPEGESKSSRAARFSRSTGVRTKC